MRRVTLKVYPFYMLFCNFYTTSPQGSNILIPYLGIEPAHTPTTMKINITQPKAHCSLGYNQFPSGVPHMFKDPTNTEIIVKASLVASAFTLFIVALYNLSIRGSL